MKSLLSIAIVASGLGSAAALADSPLTDAFSDYLGACWANHQDGQPAPEVYCFERLESNFIRIVRQNPGPHGMFYNEEHLFWDAQAERILSVMYTSGGHVIESDGAIENSQATLFAYRESGEMNLRMHWGAVTGDSASFIREQYLGEDYGGWNTEAERVFTRQPATTSEELASTISGHTTFSEAIEAFGPLMGACWSASFDDSAAVDTHCFTDLLGRYVRDRHVVPGNPDYSGETVFHYDRELDGLVFRYVNSIGGRSIGSATISDNGIEFGGETYTSPDGEEQTFRGRYYDMSDAGYSSQTEQLVDGEWVVVSEQRFTRAGGPNAE